MFDKVVTTRREGTHWEAWRENGSSKLSAEGASLQNMKNEIDRANQRAEALGYKAVTWRIVEVHRVINYDDEGMFMDSTETKRFIETYPAEKPAEVWVYDDGGRSEYFKAEKVGDCCARAIAIATGKDYKEVYDAINRLAKKERTGKNKKGKSSARDGVYKDTAKKLLQEYGWTWHPTMTIGSGCKVHLKADELPKGRLILFLSKHYTCMIDGVIHDTYDCSREGTRCVYGYFTKE